MNLADTLDQPAPPPGLSAPRQALWWLAKGRFQTGPEWEKAHNICQGQEGERNHDLVHALVHLIEGDVGNSGYWYHRAGGQRTSEDPAAEWRALQKVVE